MNEFQDYICRDCGRTFVVSVMATAFKGPCDICGSWTFKVLPHESVGSEESKT